MQQLYWYTTAVLAKKFGIQIHAVQVLSTHMHEVLTDTRGTLPAFLRERNRAFANALKCHRKWPEEVFQRAAANCVKLFGTEAILRQIGYTLANCVEAGLVESPEHWPGVSEMPDGCKRIRVARPNIYFDPKNPVWPAEAELSMELPSPLTDTYGESGALACIRATVAHAVAMARNAAHKAKKIVPKIAKILKASIFRRSRSFERFGSREPTFAAAGNVRHVQAALTERQSFLANYRRALDALKAGDLSELFPAGTWRWATELLPPSLCTRSMSVASTICPVGSMCAAG